jgi:TolA-binding protein
MSMKRHKWICAVDGSRADLPATQALRLFFLLCIVALGLSGCATLGMGNSSKFTKSDATRIRKLERELSRKQKLLEDYKERNMVLERGRWTVPTEGSPQPLNTKGSLSAVTPQTMQGSIPVPFQPSAAGDNIVSVPLAFSPHEATTDAKGWNRPAMNRAAKQIQKPAALPAVLPAKKIATAPSQILPAQSRPQAKLESVGSAETGEHFLYSKILETYRKKNVAEMDQSVRLLLKAYPDSVFADNAFYLSGLLAYERENFDRALSLMNRVVRDFPRGNKAVSALMAKASIEKKMGQTSEARRSLIRVQSLYPGSPEANHVAVELKLLDLAAKKKRES